MKGDPPRPQDTKHLYLAGRTFLIEFDDNSTGEYLCIFDTNAWAGRFIKGVTGEEVIIPWTTIWRMTLKESE